MGKIFFSLLDCYSLVWEIHSAFIAAGNFCTLLSDHYIMPPAFEKYGVSSFLLSIWLVALSNFIIKCTGAGIFPPG